MEDRQNCAIPRRVQKLVDSGVIQIVAVTDPLTVGSFRMAMIGVRVEGDITTVADQLAKYREVDYVVVTAGNFDILVEAICDDDEHLLELLQRIRAIPSVRSTESFVYLKLQKPFFFAGVFDFAKDNEGNDFPSVNIITTEPNEYLKSLPHHRMPAILHREDVKAWMDSRLGNAEARKLIKTVPKDEMEYHFLGPLINKASNDVPEALEPIAH